jgi:hypothetical protein
MKAKEPFRAHSLNWDMPGLGFSEAPVLNPRDIVQVAFLLEDASTDDEQRETAQGNLPDKRFVLGQLSVQWRCSMGDRGSISTGWLTGKKR